MGCASREARAASLRGVRSRPLEFRARRNPFFAIFIFFGLAFFHTTLYIETTVKNIIIKTLGTLPQPLRRDFC